MICLQHVYYTYPHTDVPALQDISLNLAAGQALVCTGRSGCGKSTLLRVINGLAPHYLHGTVTGLVQVEGQHVADLQPARIAQKVGTLFQDPERQFFALTVEDEIALSLQWRGWSVEAVNAAVHSSAATLGIEGLLEQSIFGLSEGQKQKVALASLLACTPRALILDEPSANLDPEATADLALTLNQLKTAGMALLIVDHRLAWLRDVADSVMVLDKGQCVAQGGFSLLDNADLRQQYGLRNTIVDDPRHSLPPLPPLLCPTDTAEHQPAVAPTSTPVSAPVPALSCHDVDFGYKGADLLFSKAQYAFAAGSIVALVGDNGVGKTSLARLLTGLEKPATGRICVAGDTVAPKKLPQRVQLVLQNAGHQLRMNTVQAELTDAASLSDEDASTKQGQIQKLIDTFDLGHVQHRHPQSLSGGEKQRLAVACAAVRNPAVLILDEPTSGLDGENMRRMAACLHGIAATGTCVLLITHDLELMALVCTTKLVLEKHTNTKEDRKTA